MSLRLQLTAEQQIGDKVREIDAIRTVRLKYGDRFIPSDEVQAELIAGVEAEIAELQKITGPRRCVGVGALNP